MGLLNIIERDKNLRRIFGERELVIIRKQLLGVPLKPSEKVRLSRDIRKKFEVIKSLTPYSNNFNLKPGLANKETIEKVKKEIFDSKYFPDIKKIVLFGSTAEHKQTLLSDIDIAVEFDKIDVSEGTKFRIKILGNFDDRVDIQVYNILPDKLKKEIDTKGRIIYERKDK